MWCVNRNCPSIWSAYDICLCTHFSENTSCVFVCQFSVDLRSDYVQINARISFLSSDANEWIVVCEFNSYNNNHWYAQWSCNPNLCRTNRSRAKNKICSFITSIIIANTISCRKKYLNNSCPRSGYTQNCHPTENAHCYIHIGFARQKRNIQWDCFEQMRAGYVIGVLVTKETGSLRDLCHPLFSRQWLFRYVCAPGFFLVMCQFTISNRPSYMVAHPFRITLF